MHRRHATLLATLATLVLACDETFDVENQPPTVHIDSANAVCTQDGHLFIRLTITDPESDPVDLALVVGNPATHQVLVGPAGDGPLGLTSSRADLSTSRDAGPLGARGVHLIHWASAEDLDAAAAESVCALGAFSGQSECEPAPATPAGTLITPWTRAGGPGETFEIGTHPGLCPREPLNPVPDAGADSAARVDSGVADSGVVDASPDAAPDAQPADAAVPDAQPADAEVPDAQPVDAALPDAQPVDAALPDALAVDALVPDAAEVAGDSGADALEADALQPDAG